MKAALKISIPLTIASFYLMGIEFFEKFLIQVNYGSEEQSYFYIANKWAAVIIIFSSSSLQIFWQSLVKSIAAGDIKKAGEIFQRLDGLLFYFVLSFGLAWSFMGKEFLALLLGKDFTNAGNILVLMAIYPISQVFGQMGTTIAVASGRSKEYMLSAIGTATVGLVISYFLLVPKNSYIPGLELGSFGLAIKTAIYGLLAVQPITFLNCRYLSISYREFIFKKVKIFLFLFASLIIFTIIVKLFSPNMPNVIRAMIKATFFMLTAGIVLFKWPAFCGVSKEDLEKIKNNALLLRIVSSLKK